MFNNFSPFNRRTFLKVAGAACVTKAILPVQAQSPAKGSGVLPLRLGQVVWVSKGESIDAAIQGVHELGLPTCQIGFEELTADVAAPLKKALAKYDVAATAFSEHGPGERVFNFYQGPATIGIVPRALREARIQNLKLAADMAVACGIPAIHTHCGFIPEDPNLLLYLETVAAVKKIADYCKERGLNFLCETGEETPITMRRMIEDVGTGNVFINLDPANMIGGGKGNPVDAMDVFGHLVRGIHAKDALPPTDTRNFGQETPIGEGKVDFPGLFAQLRKVNYKGPITIEREIDGPEKIKDILKSKAFLENLIWKTYRS